MSQANAANNSTHRATTQVGADEVHEASAREELSTLKARLGHEQARRQAKYTGWKPLTLWYTVWALLIGFGSIRALIAGDFGAFLIGALATGLICLYVKYLYTGGTHRVWFFIF